MHPIINKIRNQPLLLITVFLFAYLNTKASNDTLKRNAIYINATKCIADDILGSGNTYIAGGYWRTFNKFRVDIGGGHVVYHSQPTDDILSISVAQMTGFYIAVEADRILKNHIYFGFQLIYRHTVSVDGPFDHVKVNRESTSAILKVGYTHTNKKGWGIDIGLGAGIKYISSFNNKEFTYSLKEFPSGKTYNYGSGFYPAILLLEVKLFKKF